MRFLGVDFREVHRWGIGMDANAVAAQVYVLLLSLGWPVVRETAIVAAAAADQLREAMTLDPAKVRAEADAILSRVRADAEKIATAQRAGLAIAKGSEKLR